MLQNEDFARMKVNEAIQNGIRAQRIYRELHASKPEKNHDAVGLKRNRLVFIFVAISLSVAGTVAVLSIF